MTGDLNYYRPAEEPSATLIAGTGGEVPSRGAALEVTGENASGAEVSALSNRNNFVATLVDTPVDLDEEATFAAGDVVGEVTVRVTHFIEWLEEDSASTLAPGDDVVMTPTGARTFDPVDTGADDQPEHIIGKCWVTANKDEGTDGKVAVVRQRL